MVSKAGVGSGPYRQGALSFPFSCYCELLIFLGLQGVGREEKLLGASLPLDAMVIFLPACLLQTLTGMEDDSDEGLAKELYRF